MSVEQAIVDFVVQGVGGVDQATGKISTDLTALERSSRTTEQAAREAADASREAVAQARQLIGKLNQAVELARRAANALGVEEDSRTGRGLSLVSAGLSSGAAGASVGASIGSIVPGVGTLVGGAAGFAVGGAIGVGSKIVDFNEQDAAREKRLAQSVARELRGGGDDLTTELLRQAGLARLDGALSEGRTGP